jgi:AraC family transcriptional regulator
MLDSAREEHATASEPSSYALHQSVVPPAVEHLSELNGGRPFHHRIGIHPADPLLRVSPPDAVSRRTASWPGMTVEILEARRRGRVDYHFCAPFHLLAVYERGARHDGCTVIEGLPKSNLQDCSRKLVFVPAGHRYHDWHEPRTLSRVVFFYIDPTHLAMSPHSGFSSPSLAPRLFFEDRPLMETALKLAALIETGSSDHRTYFEALGVVLAYELARVNLARQEAEARVNGGLAAWQRRKAVAYIDEHLAEPISLAALAQLVGLSSCYFCRAFRQSFGMPPQRYQLSQRIERAKALLARHAASVTEVSHTIGYADTSAFCTAFRRVTGLTPSAYRRNLG